MTYNEPLQKIVNSISLVLVYTNIRIYTLWRHSWS